jgi:hypothetical protein
MTLCLEEPKAIGERGFENRPVEQGHSDAAACLSGEFRQASGTEAFVRWVVVFLPQSHAYRMR